jgi:large subunit ribosomal protein L4
MASPKAPILDASGKKTKDATLSVDVFAAEVKPHIVHETVRAEQNARRAGTRGAKSRGPVSGGRAKPWRQKGTGRARAGTTRAPQWVGGGVAFPPGMRTFEVKVNKKAVKAAFRAALTSHASAGTLALLEDDAFDEPSSRKAAALVSDREQPLLLVAQPEQEAMVKSFRNLERVLVTVPAELEVAELVWARSVLVSEAALPLVEARAG